MSENIPTYDTSYDTTDLKLASLILSEIPRSRAEIYAKDNSIRKIIRLIYSSEYQEDLEKLIKEFINREARVDMYEYNKNLATLRERVRREQGRKDEKGGNYNG